MMKRWAGRIILLLLAVTVPAGVIIARYGSEALLVPARRDLQDYHQRILGNQGEHGLRIVPFTAPDNSAAFIALPSDHPGVARKSRALRDDLSRRGLTLPAFGETLGTIILLHGRNGRKEDHLPVAERLCAAGFACICWDLPAHGDSPLPFATFGHQECALLPALLEAARQAHPLPAPTALFGYSQGGAIALQAAAGAENDYVAVVSIAAFSDLQGLIKQGARDIHPTTAPLAAPISQLVRLGTRLRADFDPADIRPELAAAKLRIPIRLVHGADDSLISPDHSHRLHAAIPHRQKSLQIVPGARHGDVLAVGGTALYADLCAFYLEHLPPDQPGTGTK